MNKRPPSLVAGDRIRIVAPAKAVDQRHVDFARNYLTEKGFEVVVSTHCTGRSHYFSGTLSERLEDFQEAINDTETKAILCARGGYGCVQLIDRLEWAGMIRFPKWIIGFSDVTYLHQRLHQIGMQSIHGTMPLNFASNSSESLETLLDALQGREYTIQTPASAFNKTGAAQGILTGGNLSIVYANLGTPDQINSEGTILFLEEVGEPLYSIDRMFHALRRTGILSSIRGLIVGGMTDINDSEVSFGSCLEEMISSHFTYRSIPIAFGVPAGHLEDNRALNLGANVQFDVDKTGAKISFTPDK